MQLIIKRIHEGGNKMPQFDNFTVYYDYNGTIEHCTFPGPADVEEIETTLRKGYTDNTGIFRGRDIRDRNTVIWKYKYIIDTDIKKITDFLKKARYRGIQWFYVVTSFGGSDNVTMRMYLDSKVKRQSVFGLNRHITDYKVEYAWVEKFGTKLANPTDPME